MKDMPSKDIIQQVFDMSRVILQTFPMRVIINNNAIDDLASQMKIDGVPKFGNEEDAPKYRTGLMLGVLKELVASSINYCYWYGAHDIRPNGVSSTSMYDDVNACFDGAIDKALRFEDRIDNLIHILSIHRYPLIEERKRHLLDLCEGRKAEIFAGMILTKEHSPERLFHEMIERFQGFASDTFLKRASLFFIQLYRKYGWYKDDLMTTLFVPADYQVPKILRHFKCFHYADKLRYAIQDHKLIHKHSLMELQIRAATVIVCTQLQYSLGWNIADIDTYLFTKRKLTDEPFHLTITTDY